MRPRLRISKFDNVADYSVGKRFRFAVVDLDRGKDYPVNFVCLLPSQLKPEGNDSSVFRRVFGEESLLVAKRLLEGFFMSRTLLFLTISEGWRIYQAILRT